jgi:hypothetical protein
MDMEFCWTVSDRVVLIAKQDDALLLRRVISHRTSEMNCNCNSQPTINPKIEAIWGGVANS